MEGHPDSRVASTATTAGDLAPLAAAFRAALAAPDVRGARALIARAAAAGAAAGALYVEVVRPALAELQHPGRDVRARLAAGIGEAILADLVGVLPVAEPGNLGRAAVLSCRAQGIEAVDGSVAIDFLQADGWAVDRLTAPSPLGACPEMTTAGIELVVAVTAGPRDAMTLAQACTDLRRLPDPPVILLCDFSGRRANRSASVALGADAVAHDPQELVRHASRRLPASGHRRWGVRLSRLGATLTLAPTGSLDATSVGRLADVALTRAGTFSRLLVDLRDLADCRPAGLRRLAAWPALPGLRGVEVVVVAEPPVRGQLTAFDARRALRLVAGEDAANLALA